MLDDVVAPYVQPYGFAALGPMQWQKLEADAEQPKLTLTMLGHKEIENHTFYEIRCQLESKPSLSLNWCVHRRLAHLREGLHDFVQGRLGSDYDAVFGETRFARHGGLPGTTARLQAWLEKLAIHMNEGAAPPVIVAQVLHFCEAPKPPSGTTVQSLLDFSDIPRPQAKASAPFSADFDFASLPTVGKAHSVPIFTGNDWDFASVPTVGKANSTPKITRKVSFEDEV